MATEMIFAPVQQELSKVEQLLQEVSAVDSPDLATMLTHVLQSRGKRLRPTITLLAGHLFHYQPRLHLPAAAAVEILHTATLVHDDVIDKSPQRRGQATVNHLWGNDIAILLGDYLITAAEEMATGTGNLSVTRMLAHTIMAITRAEIEEDFNHFNLRKTPEQYYQQISDKTAELFVTAVAAGAVLGEASTENVARLQTYGRNLGMSFQIVDDILDFTSTEAHLGKPVGADLRQGTITLPVILFRAKYPQDKSLPEFVAQCANTELLQRAIQNVASSSAISDCYQAAEGYCARAREALEGLPEGIFREALAAITELVVAR